MPGAGQAANGKSDYGNTGSDHTVVSKTIYSTPKSDRIDSGKSGRLDLMSEPLEIDDELEVTGVPEISIPHDPHAGVQAQAALVSPRARPALNFKGKPIGIAWTNGKLRLNRYHTLKVPMPHDDCRGFANVVAKDYKLPKTAINVLADNMVIVQKRICASNGSVVFTCYHREATVSLRRQRPDDGCT